MQEYFVHNLPLYLGMHIQLGAVCVIKYRRWGLNDLETKDCDLGFCNRKRRWWGGGSIGSSFTEHNR